MNEQIFARDTEIAKSILRTSQIMINCEKEAYPPKRIFKKIDRTPGKRMKKQAARLRLPISAIIGAADIARIMMRPLPKYPKGSPWNHNVPQCE